LIASRIGSNIFSCVRRHLVLGVVGERIILLVAGGWAIFWSEHLGFGLIGQNLSMSVDMAGDLQSL
jgi:hypothetical protein